MSNAAVTATNDEFVQLVVFQLDNEYYGVDIAEVNTIIRMQEITAVPRTQIFVEGVINLRGSIIPVIDLRIKFGLTAAPSTKSSRIVVVDASGQMIGMVVDAVAETLSLPLNAIEPPSPVICSVDASYLKGIGKQGDRLVILLDLNKVLTASEQESLKAIESQLEAA